MLAEYGIIPELVSFILGVVISAVVVRIDIEGRLSRLEAKVDLIVEHFGIEGKKK